MCSAVLNHFQTASESKFTDWTLPPTNQPKHAIESCHLTDAPTSMLMPLQRPLCRLKPRKRPVISSLIGYESVFSKKRSRRSFLSKLQGILPISSDAADVENPCIIWTGAVKVSVSRVSPKTRQRHRRRVRVGRLVFGKGQHSCRELAFWLVYGNRPNGVQRRSVPICQNDYCVHPHHNFHFTSRANEQAHPSQSEST